MRISDWSSDVCSSDLIAPIYPKTAEGHQAPLRRVDVTQPWPSDLAGIGGDIYTPTFIVVENGTEVARLRGYPGEHFFWPLLNEMLQGLPPLQPDSAHAADSSGAGWQTSIRTTPAPRTNTEERHEGK